MEACASSPYRARRLTSRGYRIKLVPPQFVAKPRHGNQTDGNDAERKLLVQCAQAAVNAAPRRDDALCGFARRLLARGKRRTTVIVAVANRLARVAYALLKHQTDYQPHPGLACAGFGQGRRLG